MPAMINRKKTKRHKMIYKMLHRRLQIIYAASLVAPVVLLLSQTQC